MPSAELFQFRRTIGGFVVCEVFLPQNTVITQIRIPDSLGAFAAVSSWLTLHGEKQKLYSVSTSELSFSSRTASVGDLFGGLSHLQTCEKTRGFLAEVYRDQWFYSRLLEFFDVILAGDSCRGLILLAEIVIGDMYRRWEQSRRQLRVTGLRDGLQILADLFQSDSLRGRFIEPILLTQAARSGAHPEHILFSGPSFKDGLLKFSASVHPVISMDRCESVAADVSLCDFPVAVSVMHQSAMMYFRIPHEAFYQELK